MEKVVENPWRNMEQSVQRRVDIDTQHNFFWMTDVQGNYGFYLQTERLFDDANNLDRLNGVSILKRNSDKPCGEFFLVLHRKEDWEIFYALCSDLIKAAYKCGTDKEMFAVFETRFRSWQHILSEA